MKQKEIYENTDDNFLPIIYDTTLREGMQTPGGIGATIDQRIYAANLISEYADWVEIGMPANNLDYEIISSIKDSYNYNNRNAGIAVLCRNNNYDIERASDVLRDYDNTLAHLFIGTSQQHRKHRFNGGWSSDDYVSNIKKSVELAASKPFSKIMFSPEDSYRSFSQSRDDFFRYVDAAIQGYKKGGDIVGRNDKFILNFPDTVGYSTISEFNEMLDKIIEHYGKSIEISVHGHNDIGASNQQAIEVYLTNRANWLQTTFGGLGERNGIATTECVIASLYERDMIKNINENSLKRLVPVTTAILASLGRRVPQESPISGSRTNISTAGIHTDVSSKDSITYHINAEKFGGHPQLEFGPTSGVNQIIPMLEKIGMKKEKKDLGEFVNYLKSKSNIEKRALSDTDVMYEAIHQFSDINDPLVVDDYYIITKKNSKAMVYLDGKYEENNFHAQSMSDGSIEAIINALDDTINHGQTIELVDFVPRVIPKIPCEYLSWQQGSFPKIPYELDMHSDLKVITKIKSKDEEKVYSGYASGEDSFQTMLDSVIDSVVKMTTIKKYIDQKPKQ